MDRATRSQNLHVPPAPFIPLHTPYTDLERRRQIKKDRFPVSSSLLLMSLLLSHLLSLFFCWLKFDFHHPSSVIVTPPLPLFTSLTLPPSTLASSLQGSLFQTTSEAKDNSDLGNSCELLFGFYHFFFSLFLHPFTRLSLFLIVSNLFFSKDLTDRLCTWNLQSQKKKTGKHFSNYSHILSGIFAVKHETKQEEFILTRIQRMFANIPSFHSCFITAIVFFTYRPFSLGISFWI